MSFDKEIMHFEAVTYNGEEYHFIVTPQKEIYCIEFGMHIPASILEIKPSFILRNKKGETITSLEEHLRQRNQTKNKGDKIFEWKIEPELFDYLISNSMITFSVFSAELFSFDEKYHPYANDSRFQTRYCKSTRQEPKKRTLKLEQIKKDIYE